jgi:hypothetical protein
MSTLNNGIIKVGDVVNLRINITNPSDVEIESVIIYQSEIKVLIGSTNTMLFIEYRSITQGGEYSINVEGFVYRTKDGGKTQHLEQIHTESIIVFGLLSIVDIYTHYESFIFEDTLDSKKIYFELNNQNNYDVYEITINNRIYTESQINIHDNGIWIELQDDFVKTLIEIVISNIKYRSNNIELENDSIIKEYFYYALNRVPLEISTINDLNSIKKNHYYILINDIDLEKYSWNPISFEGILDGNGFSIKNLTLIARNNEQKIQSFGLFEYVSGLVMNLNVENAFISVDVKSEAYVGILSGRSTNSHFVNTNISGIVNFVTENGLSFRVDNGINGNSFVGGLVGRQSESKIIDNNTNIFINVSSTTGYLFVGGISGGNNGYVNMEIINVYNVKN